MTRPARQSRPRFCATAWLLAIGITCLLPASSSAEFINHYPGLEKLEARATAVVLLEIIPSPPQPFNGNYASVLSVNFDKDFDVRLKSVLKGNLAEGTTLTAWLGFRPFFDHGTTDIPTVSIKKRQLAVGQCYLAFLVGGKGTSSRPRPYWGCVPCGGSVLWVPSNLTATPKPGETTVDCLRRVLRVFAAAKPFSTYVWTQLALVVAAALVVGRHPLRRAAAGALVLCSFALSWVAPGDPIGRVILGGVAVVSMALTTERAFSSRLRLLSRERLGHLPAIPFRSVLSLRTVGFILLEILVGGVALVVLMPMQHPGSASNEILRLVAGAALIYAVMALVFDLVHVCLLLAGSSLPMIHRTPVAARSVAEFWGRRWNLFASGWLREFCYRPLARRGRPALGILWTFFVSGLLHGWMALVALGACAGFAVLVFFVIQGVMVLAENRLNISTWPAAAARAWTIAALLIPSPLFVDPALRLVGL